MATQRSGINRALMWVRKVLQVTEETDSPRVLSEELRPIVDVFGWERLPEEQFLTATAPDPAVIVASEATPPDILRVVLHSSLEHTDTGVTHTAWQIKRRNPGALDVGVPTDRITIAVGEFLSMIGRTYLIEGDFMIAEVAAAPAAGQLTFRQIVIDLPIGEYIPPL